MTSDDHSTGPFKVRWGKDRYSYSVTGNSFRTEWKSGMDCASLSYPLYGMSPDLIETVGRSPETTKAVRVASALLASAVIIFFSDFNTSIPLLAPFLFLLCGWWLVNALRQVVPRRWTEVRKLSGETGFSMVQPEHRTQDWVKFEQALSAAIRKANETRT